MTTFKDFLRWYNNKDVNPKKKLIASVLTVFVVTAIQSLKQWVATTITVPVRRRVHF